MNSSRTLLADEMREDWSTLLPRFAPSAVAVHPRTHHVLSARGNDLVELDAQGGSWPRIHWTRRCYSGAGLGHRVFPGRARPDWPAYAHQLIFLGLSWIFYFRALQLGKVSQVAPVDRLSVAIAIGLSAVFLGEKLTWHTSLGAALIIGGTPVLIF